MRTTRFICTGTSSRLLSGGMLLSMLLFAACSDEHETGRHAGTSIGFNVTALQEAGNVSATTRTATVPLPQVEITPIEGETTADGKELYLHTFTEESIVTVDARKAGDGVSGENGGATTKAAPVTTATMYDNATVFAAVYPSTDTWNNTVPPSYFFDTQVKKAENWTTAYHWPGLSKKVAFFAYAPHHCAGVVLNTGITTPGAPAFSYTVPTDVTTQTDLLTASSVDVPGVLHAPASLAFRHALTAVRFETGADLLPGMVTQITLKGVYGTATHRIGETVWSGHGGIRNFVQTLATTTPDPNVPGTAITQPAGTFMMIPQTLPSGASLEVVYTDKLTNTPRTLTASIAGKTWTMGKTVTYRISTNSIVMTPTLTVTAPEEFEHTGGNKNYTVTSYLQVTRTGDPTTTIPAPWTVEFSENGGASWSNTKPAWLTAFTTNGAGDTTPTNHTASVGAQDVVISHPQNESLKAAPPVNDGTNTNIYDLSTKGGTASINTANCYIVNAAGRYRLPLVYGNAIKNGTANASAYTSTASGANVLKHFINHRKTGITAPYIYNNANCAPANCTLVWQDEKDLVMNVNLSNDGHFLEFTVAQNTIKQGNAVVAVRDASNTVMWSWHIWVTDYKPGVGDETITNKQNKQYTIMPVNIGWCDGEIMNYAERTVQVRFTQQTIAGHTPAPPQVITVKQKAYRSIALGNNTYFQWGRKDPFVGAFDGNINKEWYNEAGVASASNPATQAFALDETCITSGIQHPGTFCTNRYMDNKYINLWSANNTVHTANDDPVVKTVYDPSPAGYKLPPSNAFTGFTTTGSNTSNSSEFNVLMPWNKGWNFYCNSSKTNTVFFPASGRRMLDTANAESLGAGGICWSAVPMEGQYGARLLNYHSGVVNPLNNTRLSHGCAVRPCRE